MGIFEQAVDSVLSGKTAIKGDVSGQSVPFPKDEGARKALAEACEQLGRDIRDSFDLADDAGMTALIAKLAAYCAKQGWKTEDRIAAGLDRDIPAIASILREQPDILLGKAGISGLLKKHHQDAAQAEADLRKQIINDNSAPPLPVLRSGDYELVELLNIRHFKEESEALNHCIGKMHNRELLQDHNIPEYSPEADQYLVYAIKTRNRECRIFSLRTEKGKSCATIEYDADKKSITQIQGNPKQIPHDAPFMGNLCGALFQLRDMIDISGGIKGLQAPAADVVIMREGYVAYSDGLPLDDVIGGQVVLKPDMTADEVSRLAACESLTLNMSCVDNDFLNSVLPHKVKARLYTEQTEPLELAFVLELKELMAEKAARIKMPVLDTAEEIWANNAEILYMPQLATVDSLCADGIAFLTLPSLREAFNISACIADKVNLPSLQSARDLQVWAAEDIKVPEGACSYINGESVRNRLGGPGGL